MWSLPVVSCYLMLHFWLWQCYRKLLCVDLCSSSELIKMEIEITVWLLHSEHDSWCGGLGEWNELAQDKLEKTSCRAGGLVAEESRPIDVQLSARAPFWAEVAAVTNCCCSSALPRSNFPLGSAGSAFSKTVLITSTTR